MTAPHNAHTMRNTHAPLHTSVSLVDGFKIAKLALPQTRNHLHEPQESKSQRGQGTGKQWMSDWLAVLTVSLESCARTLACH